MSADPKKIGKFEIIQKLGEGGMGIVVKARDPHLDRIVAIKTIKVGFGDEAQEKLLIKRFKEREAKATAQLNHSNIVTLYEYGEEGSTLYLVMEYVDGKGLDSLVAQKAVVPIENLLKYVRQVASALDFAHSKGITHRDIKPANIMLTKEGDCKIADFGLAQLQSASAGITREGTAVGSPSYMSPEQVQGQEVDGRSDQFSLGVVFYELVTGVKPFSGEALSSIVYKIMRDDPVPPTVLNSRLRKGVDRVVLKVLAKNPDDRYPNCKAFADALEKAVRGEDASLEGFDQSDEKTMAMKIAPAPKPAGKKSGALAGVIVTALIAAGVGGFLLFTDQGKEIVGKVTGESAQQIPPPAPEPTPAPVAATKVPPPVTPKPAPVEVAAVKPAAPKAEAKPKMGKLVINGPAGSKVFVNGKSIGTAPISTERKPGKYEVKVTMARKKPWVGTVEIIADGTATLSPKMAALVGSFTLFSSPKATWFLDGTEMGQTPVTDKKLEVGSHFAKLKAAGYKEWTKNFVIKENSPVKNDVKLVELGKGTLTVNAVPWATIYLDGEERGKTPKVLKNVYEGTHELKLINPSFKEHVETIKLAAGEKKKVSPVLTAKTSGGAAALPGKVSGKTGKLKVRSAITGDVLLDGKVVGKTPLEIDVATGKHRLLVKRKGKKDYDQLIEIGAGQTSSHELR